MDSLSALTPIIVIIALIAAYIYYRHLVRRKRQTQQRKMIEEAAGFVEYLQRTREFPDPGPSIVPNRPGQPVLFQSAATLSEIRTTTHRGYAGTRVKVAGMPIYIGGSSPFTKSELKETGRGTLVLTTKAVIFQSSTRTQNMPLQRISGLETLADGLQIALDGRAKPFWLGVNNPVLWSLLIKLATEGGLTSRAIPAHINLITD